MLNSTLLGRSERAVILSGVTRAWWPLLNQSAARPYPKIASRRQAQKRWTHVGPACAGRGCSSPSWCPLVEAGEAFLLPSVCRAVPLPGDVPARLASPSACHAPTDMLLLSLNPYDSLFLLFAVLNYLGRNQGFSDYLHSSQWSKILVPAWALLQHK